MEEIKEYLKKKYKKPGKVFLGLVHRLDRPVMGIVLFAKTTKGASRLSEQFREHTVEKAYHALVLGTPPAPRGTLVHFLKKNTEGNVTTVYDTFVPGSQRADLYYEVVGTKDGNTILKIVLGTGRSHQIRSQLAKIGCPIVGDLKYGAPVPLPDKSIALAATSLSFEMATGGERKTIAIPVPWCG